MVFFYLVLKMCKYAYQINCIFTTHVHNEYLNNCFVRERVQVLGCLSNNNHKDDGHTLKSSYLGHEIVIPILEIL